ncbi:SCO2523 family variant P-loop protein [Frankia sp. QA3]|uniref:SCO2523 family variant P-loop protein n=1 Tax=Frankia sp. QA3 TaxID=710111 RepID=UPI000269C3B8|nr:SCO2523 family variant P-loop protein [Frankia sp. QA3]EIV94754.1 CobQ/CobB/MinD/ParA nucleotide binding domain-containing protein [Frankia sp. QA3]
MILFATSDKGGTGRSVTSCNVALRCALRGSDVCYLDFDFGSPTAGAILHVGSAARGIAGGRGLHSYLEGSVAAPAELDLWRHIERAELRPRPAGAGRLVLLPGDEGGGEFPIDDEMIIRCQRLLRRLAEEFELVIVDLSAGRSYALQLVLEVTARPALQAMITRWLVFHRWTRQHIIAAAGLAYGEHGIVDTGAAKGHDRDRLYDSIRFVRTAVPDPESSQFAGLLPTQAAWLQEIDAELQKLAARQRVGRSVLLGSVPLDPVLQWREQLIIDSDVWTLRIANLETNAALDALAKDVLDEDSWEGL